MPSPKKYTCFPEVLSVILICEPVIYLENIISVVWT